MVSKMRVRLDKVNICVFVLGLLAVLFMGLPYLLLGQDAIVVYHDQLDGELIAYLLQAKHLFQGDVLPEFMNGVYKTALVPPAPAFVLLFLFTPGFVGLVCMQLVGSLCGYVGMYLLVGKVAEDAELDLHKSILPLVAAAVGVMYAYLPFLPVYGLSQYGLPLLLWCLLQVRSGKYVKTAYVYGAIYALTSSLVLVGFGVLAVVAVWTIFCVWKNRPGQKGATEGISHTRHMMGIWAVMLLLYIIENISLLKQTLGLGELGNMISHKSEYVLYSSGFGDGLWESFVNGGQHSTDFHGIFLAMIIAMLVLGLICKINKRLTTVLAIALGCNLSFALLSAFWGCSVGIALRSKLSVLGAFQLNRFLWLAPCLWYLSLAVSILLAVLLVRKQGRIRFLGVLCCVLMAAVCGITGVKVLIASNLKPNIQKLRNAEYSAISFNDYYAVGVLEQVETFIRETTGEEQEDYRVVSIGIDPAAALYHGFYCLDGYSNNYPLEYKHSFRRIIAPELDKSDYIKQSFDGWGNRCYLFSCEVPGYYTIEKNGFVFQDLDLDMEALKEMGAGYLFSAGYIDHAAEKGLVLLRETPFETEGSYYRIFLYEVK